MKPLKLVLLSLLLLVLLMISTGCLGSRVVYCGFAKSATELKGAVIIGTNKPITVTVGKYISKMNLGGMVAVRQADLALLIKLANERQDNEDSN